MCTANMRFMYTKRRYIYLPAVGCVALQSFYERSDITYLTLDVYVPVDLKGDFLQAQRHLD